MVPLHLEPAKSVIEKIGVERVAQITGKHLSRVYRWMCPREHGGTGGIIPAREQQKLLEWARNNGVELEPADFFMPNDDSPRRVAAGVPTS